MIGKTVNFIRLHDFFDRLEVEQVYSSLHLFYQTLAAQIEDTGFAEWNGRRFDRESLKEAMKLEEDEVRKVTYQKHAPSRFHFVVKIGFESGNEIAAVIADQDQYVETIRFLYEYGGRN